jgi:hypothetical protein
MYDGDAQSTFWILNCKVDKNSLGGNRVPSDSQIGNWEYHSTISCRV